MMEAGGYHARQMADGKRARIALSLDDGEIARAQKIAGVVPVSSWATIAVREKIRQKEAGEIVEPLTETEFDALRALRFLADQRDGAATAIIGAIAASMYSAAVRLQLVRFAEEANALLDVQVPGERDTPRGAAPRSREDHPKQGKR
jgi:hypothetical protein